MWRGTSQWAVPSTSDRAGNQLKDQWILFTYYSAPTESVCALSSQCLIVNVLNISIPLGITCCLHFRSIFKGEAGGWRSQAGLNHNCCGLTSLDKQSIFWNSICSGRTREQNRASPALLVQGHSNPRASRGLTGSYTAASQTGFISITLQFRPFFCHCSSGKGWSSLQRIL